MLNCHQLQKCFVNQARPVLNHITLKLLPGEFCIVVGSNGSGKSTLLKAIMSEISLDAGHVELPERSAYVTQDTNAATVPELTLFENLLLGINRGKAVGFRFYKRQREQIKTMLTAAHLGLEKYLDLPLACLSGGQRQMVAFLMAVSSNPQLLLLDEHTSALDPKSQAILMQYTSRYIQQNGITALMVTHDMSDALTYGNRLIMLHEGSIVVDLAGQNKQALTQQTLFDLFGVKS